MTVDQERAYWEGIDPADRCRNICSDPEHYGLARITAALDLEAGVRVLDLGCGPGRIAIPLAQLHAATVVGLDISFAAVNIARDRALQCNLSTERLSFVHGYGRTIPTAEDFFDAAYSMLVFQHLPGDAVAQYLAELGRVLISGGRWIFQYVEGDQHHPFNHEHTEDDMRAWCAEAGLIVVRVDVDESHPEWRWVTGVRA